MREKLQPWTDFELSKERLDYASENWREVGARERWAEEKVNLKLNDKLDKRVDAEAYSKLGSANYRNWRVMLRRLSGDSTGSCSCRLRCVEHSRSRMTVDICCLR